MIKDNKGRPTLARKRQEVAPDPPTSYYLLLLVKILLVVIILLWLAPLVTGAAGAAARNNHQRNRRKRSELRARRLRLECQNEGECALLVPEESLNCVNRCMSKDCYARIFANDPLEDGEVDLVRGQQFEDCVQEELRILRRQLYDSQFGK